MSIFTLDLSLLIGCH